MQAASNNGMLSQQLDKLRDIHEAPPISDFPIALGWWIVLVALILVLFFGGRSFIRYRRSNAWKTPALLELDLIRKNYFDTPSNTSGSPSTRPSIAIHTAELSALLRRCMATRYQSTQFLTLSGKAWQSALLEKVTLMSEIEAHTIALSHYEAKMSKLDHQCFDAIARWIKSKG